MKKRYRSAIGLRRLPLRLMLVVPFVLLTLGAVSLVGYLSYRNGEAIVTELSKEIRSEIAARVEQKLTDHLKTPQLVNQINADAFESGLLNAQDLSGLQGYLTRQLAQFPTLSGITIATERPDYIGIMIAENQTRVLSQWNRSQGGVIDSQLNDQGQIVASTVDLDYDHRRRPWYQNAIQANRSIWQDAYLTTNPSRLVISADRPFYDAQRRVVGVVDAEVKLSSLSEFLGSLKVGQTGATFIMEQNSLLIASSDDQPPFNFADGEEKRLSASESDNPQIQAAARYLSEKFGDLQRIDRPYQLELNRDGQLEFLTVMPFGQEGIKWLVVVIVPKADFTQQIEVHTRNTIWLCIATLLVAIALSFRASHWIAKPLLRMSRASRAIAAGQLDQRVPIDLPVAELDVMAYSFNQMAQQLGQSFDRVNDALQASEAKFTKVFRASPDAIAITTVSSGRYVDVNTSFCRLSGFDRDEIIGRTPFELNFPFTPAGLTRFGRILRKRRILRNVEVDFHTKTGEAKTALVSAELIDIEGEPRILSVIKDISERKRAEAERQRVALERKQIAAELERAKEAAEAASRAKSQFLANMSHELRSPLNAILGFAQLMTLSRKLPPEHREYVNIIQHSGEHLLHLINDILDSSKIEAGCLMLDERNFDLHRLLQELIEMFRLKAQEKSIDLVCDRSAALSRWVYADELKLRQVLINLLSNAIKFTQAGSVTLRVGMKEVEQAAIALHFSVFDTGIGIESNQIEQIFEAFVQTASGRQTTEGTGLGLSISQAFVRLMGGKIDVQSRVGEGSVFSFTILAKTVSGQISNSPDRRLLSAKPCRCLIATEDDRDRQLLSTLLHADFDIRTVNHPQALLELWKLWQPQLIWMDVQLLAADDAALAQQIRRASGAGSPVILAIGKDGAARSIALSAGCDDFLFHPLHETQIRGTINQYQCLSSRHAPTSAARPIDFARLRSQLALLPNDWIANLHQAALEGDLDRMLTLIEAIRPQHNQLAEAIASLVSSFQYVQLLTLTQPSDFLSP